MWQNTYTDVAVIYNIEIYIKIDSGVVLKTFSKKCKLMQSSIYIIDLYVNHG